MREQGGVKLPWRNRLPIIARQSDGFEVPVSAAIYNMPMKYTMKSGSVGVSLLRARDVPSITVSSLSFSLTST